MPPWFIDIESATEMEAKSNGVPPASRTASHAWRTNSPSSALHGVTRPSVEATPTNGFFKSASLRPSARRNARCGARSRPSTVTREGRIGMVFFIFLDDFLDRFASHKTQPLRARGRSALRRRLHQLLQDGIGLEAYLAGGAILHRIPHLLCRDRNAGQQHGPLEGTQLHC